MLMSVNTSRNYIQSDRNQFINPLCIFTTTSSLYLDFTPTRVYNGESFIAENSTDGKAIIRLYNSYGSSGISYIFRNNGDNIGTYMRNIYDAQERLYRITFLVDAPRKYIHLTIGDEIVWTTSKATIPLTQHDTEPNFFLLKAYAKIHGFKFWDNGILKRDMIPVRVVTEHGENEGAMFDKISGIMCYNQGTGSFIIGPDL